MTLCADSFCCGLYSVRTSTLLIKHSKAPQFSQQSTGRTAITHGHPVIVPKTTSAHGIKPSDPAPLFAETAHFCTPRERHMQQSNLHPQFHRASRSGACLSIAKSFAAGKGRIKHLESVPVLDRRLRKSGCRKRCSSTSTNVAAALYLRGMKREEWVAPIPGLPCLTGL